MSEDTLRTTLWHAKGLSSHNEVLIKALLISKGPVCDVGGGLFSTPMLHWFCKAMDRELVTYEDDPLFYEPLRIFKGGKHKVIKIDNWDDMDFARHWGVVLIDHTHGDRRARDAVNFKDTADYIILHDTDQETCGYGGIWQYFRHRYDWDGYRTTSSVVSNFKALDDFGRKI